MIDQKEFEKNLSKLLRKYKMHNCIFAGNYFDDDKEQFIGIFATEYCDMGKAPVKSIMLSLLNAGRIYQSAREFILKNVI